MTPLKEGCKHGPVYCEECKTDLWLRAIRTAEGRRILLKHITGRAAEKAPIQLPWVDRLQGFISLHFPSFATGVREPMPENEVDKRDPITIAADALEAAEWQQNYEENSGIEKRLRYLSSLLPAIAAAFRYLAPPDVPLSEQEVSEGHELLQKMLSQPPKDEPEKQFWRGYFAGWTDCRDRIVTDAERNKQYDLAELVRITPDPDIPGVAPTSIEDSRYIRPAFVRCTCGRPMPNSKTFFRCDACCAEARAQVHTKELEIKCAELEAKCRRLGL